MSTERTNPKGGFQVDGVPCIYFQAVRGKKRELAIFSHPVGEREREREGESERECVFVSACVEDHGS